jgi:hypothetical protein
MLAITKADIPVETVNYFLILHNSQLNQWDSHAMHSNGPLHQVQSEGHKHLAVAKEVIKIGPGFGPITLQGSRSKVCRTWVSLLRPFISAYVPSILGTNTSTSAYHSSSDGCICLSSRAAVRDCSMQTPAHHPSGLWLRVLAATGWFGGVVR